MNVPKPIDGHTIDAFIQKWAASGAAERANAQSFINELCAILGVEPPQPQMRDEAANAYVFEKSVPGMSGNSKNFIDWKMFALLEIQR